MTVKRMDNMGIASYSPWRTSTTRSPGSANAAQSSSATLVQSQNEYRLWSETWAGGLTE